MTRIAQIIPYFGAWPEWIDLYLYSCGRNKSIDFIFYTDCGIPQSAKEIPNLIFHHISLDDYYKYVGSRLSVSYKPEKIYKLTDLKPFLGLVHREELRGYDWWGFGDIDLVYGDLSMLINEENLSRYNLITTHNYHIAGHCTFMRNNEFYRDACMLIRDWQTRLGDDTHYGFDEDEWSAIVYPGIKWPLAMHRRVLSKIWPGSFNSFMDFANKVWNPRQLFKEYHTSPAPREGLVWRYDIQSGKVFNPVGLELPYLHFLFFKKTQWLETELYWRDGYYKLETSPENCKRIDIDCHGITGGFE